MCAQNNRKKNMKGHTLFCLYATTLSSFLSLSFSLPQWLFVYINFLARDCEYLTTLVRPPSHLRTRGPTSLSLSPLIYTTHYHKTHTQTQKTMSFLVFTHFLKIPIFYFTILSTPFAHSMIQHQFIILKVHT